MAMTSEERRAHHAAYMREWSKRDGPAQARAREYDRERARDPEYRERQRFWQRAHHRRQQGLVLTVEEEQAIFAMAGGVCGMCKSPERIVIDHDHQTGRVRGVLCNRCNRALGQLGDSI